MLRRIPFPRSRPLQYLFVSNCFSSWFEVNPLLLLLLLLPLFSIVHLLLCLLVLVAGNRYLQGPPHLSLALNVEVSTTACCAIAAVGDIRKSLKPRLASSAAAVEAMMRNLEAGSGHDRDSWGWSDSGACARLAAQARRCGHGIADQGCRVATAGRIDAIREE